ncbi:MAG: tetratricopeptide repeat protein [Desulfobacteraceae bacterium]
MSVKSRQYLLFAGMLCFLMAAVPWAYMRINPDAVLSHHARQAFMAKDYQKAATLYGMALEKGAADPAVRHRLGDTYLALGKFDRALDVFLQMQQKSPENVFLQVKLAQVYLLNNNFDHALALVDRALVKKPDWDIALLWQARILSRQGRFLEAIDIYYRILGEKP